MSNAFNTNPQYSKETKKVYAFPFPQKLYTEELNGLFGSMVLAEIQEILAYYEAYEMGATFNAEGAKGYVPSNLKFKDAKNIIDKQARFMFSKPIEFVVESETTSDEDKANISEYQTLIDKVFESNKINTKLIKAGKDCFIGKRIACIVNFSPANENISIQFFPSYSFVFDVSENDETDITKISTFYIKKDDTEKKNQIIYRKKYEMFEGFLHITEGTYDGNGNELDVIFDNFKTELTFMPAAVIINDGLTGDINGKSEMFDLMQPESWYSRLSNADMDSQRKGMNPTRYTVDASPSTTKGLTMGAGSYWDLKTAEDVQDSKQAKVGMLEASMSYSGSLSKTLERIRTYMYDQVDMPDLKTLDLKVASAKAMKALYSGLSLRCDEKMLSWGPALSYICKCIIEGCKIYQELAKVYVGDAIDYKTSYYVSVTNQYAIPEDDNEEKSLDIAEVESNLRTRVSYMKKWHGLNDTQALAAIYDIAKENEILNNTISGSTNALYTIQQMEEDMKAAQKTNDDINSTENIIRASGDIDA